MSLSRIRQEIIDEMGFDPDLARYYDSLDRRINSAYSELIESQPFLFAQRVADLQTYDQVDGSATQTVTALSGNLRMVTAGSAFFVQGWENGGVFVDSNGAEYTIGRIDLSPSSGFGEMFLTTPLTAAISGGNTDNWSIKFPRYPLPQETLEVMGVTDRASGGFGRLSYVSRRREEEAFLKSSVTGRAGYVIEDDHIGRREPSVAPTLTLANTGDNDLRASTTYQVAYTIKFAGMESAMSPIAKIATTATHKAIDVAGLEEVRWLASPPGGSLQRSGVLRRVYMRDVTNRGRWYLWEEVDDEDSVSDIDNQLPDYANSREEIEYWNGYNMTQWVRFYATPNEDRQLSMRLWYKPPPLMADSQSPVGAVRQVERYLKYIILADLLSGGEAQKFQKRADNARSQLDNWLMRDDERHIPRNWRQDMVNGSLRGLSRRLVGTPTRS